MKRDSDPGCCRRFRSPLVHSESRLSSVSPHTVGCAIARAFQNYLGHRDWGRKNVLQILLSFLFAGQRENRVCVVENIGFPLSFLSPGFRIIRQPAHRWLRHRESIPKLPRPSGLGQKECLKILSLLFCVKRDSDPGCCRRFRLPLVLSESRLSYCPSVCTPLVAPSREHSKTTSALGIGAERMS